MVKFNEQLTDTLAQSVISKDVWERSGVGITRPKVEESKKETPKVETKKVNEDTEVVEESDEVEDNHVCPLCESKLEAPVSKEVLAEFTNAVLEVLNEMTELGEDEDTETLEEDTEEEVVEEEDKEE
ncbi:MAG: hypothetical protein WC648_04940 [Candidatus Paceibacterota bacterium]|jgi:hypothetical protein